jgi:hypothetical protein
VITTDEQVRRLFKLSENKQLKQGAQAAKAGMSEKTARKYLRAGLLPSQMKKERHWRTREDPFGEVWGEVEALLSQAPGLEALTIFEELQRRHPGRFPDGQLRTLQRQVRVWRGLYGPDQEVYFAQVHEPGQMSQSDFTWMKSLDITIGGELFSHLLYHFVLTYSNWEYVEVCFSESFESLSTGLQNALWTVGRVPVTHRTDNLGAAKYGGVDEAGFGAHYMALMRHYGLKPTRNNPEQSHENGDVEQANYRIKERVEQALLLRGSREFVSRRDYDSFLKAIFSGRNRNRSQRLEAELAVMAPLPQRRLEDYRDYEVGVSRWSTIQVAHNTYSVPSRLIGHEVTARLYANQVEIRYGGQCVQQMERLGGRGRARIDYRHVIGSLVRKPGAFAHYRYREEMFPSLTFRQAYDGLVAQDPAQASRRYLQILEWAAGNGEAAMETALRRRLDAGEVLDFDELIATAVEAPVKCIDIGIPLPDLTVYDRLLEEVIQ